MKNVSDPSNSYCAKKKYIYILCLDIPCYCEMFLF